MSELLLQIDLFEQWASHTARKRAHCEVWLTDKQWKDLIANRDRKRAIARMRKQKWIKDAQHGSKICVKITADAVIHELKNQIRRSDKQIPQAQLCLVLFDFPNGANLARQLWREFLLSAKFQRTQLSAWTTTKDVCGELCLLIQLLGLDAWIHVYRVERQKCH